MSRTIRLPFPPSVNSYWQTVLRYPKRGGGKPGQKIPMTILSERAVEYRADVERAVLQMLGTLTPTSERIELKIKAVMPDRRARDLDNLLKGLLDSLTHARVWVDDSQIDRLLIERGRIEAPGWVEVTIERIESAQKVLC